DGGIDLRADVAARDRIDDAIEQPPFRERLYIALVEDSKPVLGKRGRRAQLAGAKRCQRPSRASNIFRDLDKTFGKRQQFVEMHPLDLKTGICRRTARI